jgi:HAD superfamily hydrolase (TIGR01509 family)
MIQHIIFDCDGVLVDSEPLSMRADVELLARHGVAITAAEAHKRFVGLTFEAMQARIEHDIGRKLPPTLRTEKDQLLLELYQQHLQEVPGVRAVLAGLAGRPAIASNSPRDRVVVALALTGLQDFFDGRITTYEEVRDGKPAPDIYLRAAEKAGVAPRDCLVIEDSVTGVTAAFRAGCRVIGFTGTHPHGQQHGGALKAAGARAVFHDMAALPPLLKGF